MIDNSIDDKWELSNSSDDIIASVWDTGGIDTLDLSGFSSNSKVDLREEAFSSFGGLTNNFSISKGVDFENAIGGSGNDELFGNDLDNLLKGGSGADVILGKGGADNLQGGSGTDDLKGGSGADLLDGGADADQIDGGADIDTLSYASSDAKVTVSLYTGKGHGPGHAKGDTIAAKSIENLIGSDFNDVLVGDNGQENTLRGGEGNDSLRALGGDDISYGEGGNDIFFSGFGADQHFGGSGYDTVFYIHAQAGVNVNLAVNRGLLGEAEGDTFDSIENLVGSSLKDVLIGDSSSNNIQGRGGDDYINGKGGADVLIGGTGNDKFVYQAGNGYDRVADFDVTGGDVVDARSYNFTDFAMLQGLIRQDGADAIVDFAGATDSLRLTNVDMNDLTVDEFLIV